MLRVPVGRELHPQPEFYEFPGGVGSSRWRWELQPLPLEFLKGGDPRFVARVASPPPQASKNPSFSLSCRILRSCSPTLAPRCHNIARDGQKNTILEQTSSNIAPKTLPRQPPGPSGGGPNPRNSSKSAVVLVVFTLRPFFPRSRKKS
mgnify:CR=1 FL=1